MKTKTIFLIFFFGEAVFFRCWFYMRQEVRNYMNQTPNGKLKDAHKKWKESAERAAFMAGRKGIQL